MYEVVHTGMTVFLVAGRTTAMETVNILVRFSD
jgi:hypothetical protein